MNGKDRGSLLEWDRVLPQDRCAIQVMRDRGPAIRHQALLEHLRTAHDGVRDRNGLAVARKVTFCGRPRGLQCLDVGAGHEIETVRPQSGALMLQHAFDTRLDRAAIAEVHSSERPAETVWQLRADVLHEPGPRLAATSSRSDSR